MENKIENIIISDGENDITIYPLAELDLDNRHYVIYTDKLTKELDKESVYVGEMINDSLRPVDSEMLSKIENTWQNIVAASNKE